MNKIKDLDKKIHKIKDINNKKDLEEINKEVKEIDKITINKLEEIIDNLLESLNSTIIQEIQHPQIFLIKLIEILVKKNLLGKNDLEMYKAFIIDLESIGYNCTKKYQINTKYNFRKYLNISTELQYYLPPNDNIIINKGYNCKFKILRHYSIKNIYNDILLIINYNYIFLNKLTGFISNIYKQHFPNIVFITPENTTNLTNTIACPESHKGYYSYYCIKRVYNKYPNMKGYLFVMDDAFIKIWNFEYYNFDIPWIMTIYISKTKNWVRDNDRELVMLNRNLKWKNNLMRFYNSEIIGHGISDFFYLPNNFIPEFISVAEVLYNYKVFLELAVPSIYGILLNYQIFYF